MLRTLILLVSLACCIDSSHAASCVTRKKGVLTSAPYTNSAGQTVTRPYAFNPEGRLAFYHNTTHPTIPAEWQTCTPSIWKGDTGYSGRIYLTSTKKCLGVYSSGDPYSSSYYLYATSATCPDSAEGQEETSKSYPFNFISFGSSPSDESRGVEWFGPSTDYGDAPSDYLCPGGYGIYSNVTTTGGGSHEPISSKAENYTSKFICDYSSDEDTMQLNLFID